VCFITPLVGSVDSSRVLIACSFASVGFFGNNKSSTQMHGSSSLKQLKTNHIISGTVSTITGIHSKIVSWWDRNCHCLWCKCTWIKHGSGPGLAYYHFHDFTRLKDCWIWCWLAVLGLRMVLVLGSTFTSLENSLTTLTNLGKNYLLFCLSLSPAYHQT
jgi:hypothetical protein